MSPEVLDIIHIKYGIKIDSQKYTEYQTSSVSMEEVRYKYLYCDHLSDTVPESVLTLIHIRGVIYIDYHTIMKAKTDDVSNI